MIPYRPCIFPLRPPYLPLIVAIYRPLSVTIGIQMPAGLLLVMAKCIPTHVPVIMAVQSPPRLSLIVDTQKCLHLPVVMTL
jgi:hypothetical protein